MTGLGQMIEHLRDRPRRHAGGQRQFPGRQLTALVELDQQLELGVAELRSAQVRVAPA